MSHGPPVLPPYSVLIFHTQVPCIRTDVMLRYTPKETYLYGKRDLFKRQKRPIHTYGCHVACTYTLWKNDVNGLGGTYIMYTYTYHLRCCLVCLCLSCGLVHVGLYGYICMACMQVCLRDDIYMCVCVCVYVCVCVRVCVSIYPATLTGPPGKRPRATHPSASANVVSA